MEPGHEEEWNGTGTHMLKVERNLEDTVIHGEQNQIGTLVYVESGMELGHKMEWNPNN